MKRRNVQQAFIGEPTGSDLTSALDSQADGDEAIELAVRGGTIMLVVPAGTPDDQLWEARSFLGGEIQLEDGRILSFEMQGDAVGAQATVKPADQDDRGAGLSSLPNVPGGV